MEGSAPLFYFGAPPYFTLGGCPPPGSAASDIILGLRGSVCQLLNIAIT